MTAKFVLCLLALVAAFGAYVIISEIAGLLMVLAAVGLIMFFVAKVLVASKS